MEDEHADLKLLEGRLQESLAPTSELSPEPDDPETRLEKEERWAVEVYDRLVRPILNAEDDGKYVAVAFEYDDFEVDSSDFRATDRLLIRHPEARVWLLRVGPLAAYRLRHLSGGGS